MVAKELFFDMLPRIPILKPRMRWFVLRGENHRHVEAIASLGSYFDLGEREVLDAQHPKVLIAVAEPGPGEFVRCWPCREDALARISQRQNSAGFRMHQYVVTICEIIFERESIRRIAEEAGGKCNCHSHCN